MSNIFQFQRQPPQPVKEPTVEELAEGLLNGWVPPSTWFVDESGIAHLGNAEYAEASRFFAGYGFEIERSGPLESFMEGWAYLTAKPGRFIHYFQKHPHTYASLTRTWHKDDHDYLAALAAFDMFRVQALASRTRFARELHEKMRTQEGCALKQLRLLSCASDTLSPT